MQQKIKVALMSYSMDNRPAKGSALYTKKLVEEFIKDPRIELTLVHFEESPDPLYTQAPHIIMEEILPPFNFRFFRLLSFFWKYRRQKFDIIHWCQPRLYPFFWLAPARKIVVTAHGGGDVLAPGSFMLSRIMFNLVFKYFHRYLDLVIADSIFAAGEIREAYGCATEKIAVTYLGGGELYSPLPPEEARLQMEQKYGVKGPYLLSISRFTPHKNIERIIEAYERLQSKKRRPERLVLVGSGAAGGEKIFTRLATSSERKSIVHLPYVEDSDLNAAYSGAEVFLFPSLNEGFGLPIIEAMASGTPVITSNITAMPEVAGTAGHCVDPYDVNAIAVAVEEVLDSEEVRKKMIAEGIERARSFTWHRTAQQTAEYYAELLGAEVPSVILSKS